MSTYSVTKNIFNRKLTVTAAMLLCGVLISCKSPQSSGATIPERELILVKQVALPFGEPSGIAYSEALDKLWVVCGANDDQHVYRLDVNGTVEQQLRFVGTDLEGIAFDAADSTLWVIDEATKMITHLDLDGAILRQHQLSYATTHNKGPEGITLGKNHTLIIVNEKEPGALITLDAQMDIAEAVQLQFAGDYSDISYDGSVDTFYVLSDESAAFFALNSRYEVVTKYNLPDTKNEGIAFDRKRKLVYIVNDKSNILSMFEAQ